ncbi:MAG: hypothetical protein R2713_00260 [Ilumatobacteraceae bacterium]
MRTGDDGRLRPALDGRRDRRRRARERLRPGRGATWWQPAPVRGLPRRRYARNEDPRRGSHGRSCARSAAQVATSEQALELFSAPWRRGTRR